MFFLLFHKSVIFSLLHCQPSLPWRARWSGALASSLVSTPAQTPRRTNTHAGRCLGFTVLNDFQVCVFIWEVVVLLLTLMSNYLSAVTKSLQRSARCPKKGDQRRRPTPAPLRSAPTKRGEVTLVIPKLHCFVYKKNSWRKTKYTRSFCRSSDPQLSASLPLHVFPSRPFIKLKECSGGRPNISRSSSSTSSFSSTTGETEALEELETVSMTLTANGKETCHKTMEFWPTLSCVYIVASLSCEESRSGNTFWAECEVVAGVKASVEEILITKNRLIESVGCQRIDYNDYSSSHRRCQCDTACQCCFIWCEKRWQIGLTLAI